MKTKESRYAELVKDVSKCTKCMKGQKKKGTQLVQDPDRSQINLWSHWQGSLEAKILVIGQDWGEKPDPESYKAWTTKHIYPSLTGEHKLIPPHKFKTDNNLVTIINKALGLDLMEKQVSLFFTNAVLCYRDKGFTGDVNQGWFQNCQPFCVRLIDIFQPEAIVTLGYVPLRALLYGGSLSYNSGKRLSISRSMQEIVETQDQLYYIQNGSEKVFKVFPVFHCGSWGTKSRPIELQIKDWVKIKESIRK